MGNVWQVRIGRTHLSVFLKTRPWYRKTWFKPVYWDKTASLFTAVGPIIFEISIWRSNEV